MQRIAVAVALGLVGLACFALVTFFEVAVDSTYISAQPVEGAALPESPRTIAQPEIPAGPKGSLQFVGTGVTRLSLLDERGEVKQYEYPQETISLPAGKYRVYHVELTNGFDSFGREGEGDSFVIAPAQTHRLGVGFPLTPKVVVSRWGRSLELDYQLVDAAGGNYRPSREIGEPRFTIRKGDREVGSGIFEYG